MSSGGGGGESGLLYKPVSTAAAIVVLLELDEFQFAEGLENVLQVLLCDAEVDVADIQAVEGNGVGMGA